MKKIEAKELSKILKEIYYKGISWIDFTDYITGEMIDKGYMENEFDDVDYIWNQVSNFWKTFAKRR